MGHSEILWHSLELHSSEHCELVAADDGWRLSGITVLPLESRPAHISYEVETDPSWRTKRARIELWGARRETLDILATAGMWTVNGEPHPDLKDCVDIDLGWTPATNLLPIRRLGLDVGATASSDAAWIKFPDFGFERSTQRYTRLAEHRWRYQSGSFECELVVNEDGLVVQYGDGYWRAVAQQP